MKTRSAIAAAFLLAGTLPALTQSQTNSFSALTGQGYEIKAVTLVPLEVAQRGDASITSDTVAITLQKDASTAVCYFSWANWLAMAKASLEATDRCALSS